MRIGVLALVGGLAAALPAAARAPVLVELYTSQGCGTCAESSRVIDRLAERKDVLPLTFSVDTWDYLGWTDTFARPEFSERQQVCADRRGAQVYTPQVMAGRGEARADEVEAVDRLIRRAGGGQGGPAIRVRPDRVTIGAGVSQIRPADVWLIRYQTGPREVEVRRGENQGKTLTYRNVVRELTRLGGWSGRSASFELPRAAREGMSTVILLQKPGCGEVIGFASV